MLIIKLFLNNDTWSSYSPKFVENVNNQFYLYRRRGKGNLNKHDTYPQILLFADYMVWWHASLDQHLGSLYSCGCSLCDGLWRSFPQLSQKDLWIPGLVLKLTKNFYFVLLINNLKLSANIKYFANFKSNSYPSRGGLFTWPNQDDQMNMTKISKHDRKIDNDEH